MDGLQLISRQQPGTVAIDNLQELKSSLAAILSRYECIAYTDDMLADAKADKKELTRLRKEIDDRRKEIKKAYLAPYDAFEIQVKELLAMVDIPLGQVKAFLDAMDFKEKQSKRGEIEAYFMQHSVALDTMARDVLNSPAFFDDRWLNKSTSAKTWQTAVDEKIAAAARDLRSIQASAGLQAGPVTARYLETLSMDGLLEYREKLAATAKAETAQIKDTCQDRRTGSRLIKISGSPDQLAQAVEALELLGLDCDVLEDDMPRSMPELMIPNFDSFVAFDLETSGTYGAASGDAPAEITEIGAVRVTNGKITDKFSMLVNPGRKILPRISRITGITDAMVAGEPESDVAIKAFADFVGDSVLVGHNIKASDLYYIDRAARRAGVRIENPFFDTCYFARTLKAAQGWENVKLEYLSDWFGVEQPEAHRAWCDAQANAEVYFKLKELR